MSFPTSTYPDYTQDDQTEFSFPFVDSSTSSYLSSTTSRLSTPLHTSDQSSAPTASYDPKAIAQAQDPSGPFLNLTTPFWSPIGSLDTIPLTPYNPHYAPGPPTSARTPSIPPPSDASSQNQSQYALPGPQPADGSLFAPAPPSTAPIPLSAFSNAYTGLTPMFGSFATTFESPTSATSPRPGGPIRGWSFSTPASRRRSSTLLNTSSISTTSASPATPQSGYSPHSGYSGYYPYPSPRSSGSSASAGPGLLRRASATSSSLTNALHMTLGAPGPKRVIHPSPIGVSPLYARSGMELHDMPEDDYSMYVKMGLGLGLGLSGQGGVGFPPLGGGEAKPARFKPTKEQLAVLIGAYNENKNPDAQTRERLANQIGGGVKPKTLQIWFQNRRSKARAKEREASLPKLHVGDRQVHDGDFDDHAASEVQRRSATSLEALRRLAHDDDARLDVLPLTVLSISAWTRFLTPGIALSAPDLGASIRLHPSPTLHLYVVHSRETYRIAIPISASSIADIRLQSGKQGSNGDAVAVSFDIAPGSAEFCSWQVSARYGYGGEGGSVNGALGDWVPIQDFTSDEVSQGGRCEMTGAREYLVPAFHQIQSLLPPSSAGPLTGMHQQANDDGIDMDVMSWRFPMASTPTPTRATHSTSTSTSLSLSTSTSLSLPHMPDDTFGGFTFVTEYPQHQPHAGSKMIGNAPSAQDHAARQHTRKHSRQRSLSAPGLSSSSIATGPGIASTSTTNNAAAAGAESDVNSDLFTYSSGSSRLASRSNTLDSTWSLGTLGTLSSLGTLGGLGSPAHIGHACASPIHIPVKSPTGDQAGVGESGMGDMFGGSAFQSFGSTGFEPDHNDEAVSGGHAFRRDGQLADMWSSDTGMRVENESFWPSGGRVQTGSGRDEAEERGDDAWFGQGAGVSEGDISAGEMPFELELELERSA